MAVSLEAQLRQHLKKREKRDETKKAADEADKEHKESEAELYDALRDSGMKSIKVEIDGQTVTFQPRETIYGRILDLDKALEAFEAEARTDELTKPGVEKRRLNELVRERLESGHDLPDGVDWYPQRYVSISRKG